MVPGLLKEIKDRGYLLALASSTSRNRKSICIRQASCSAHRHNVSSWKIPLTVVDERSHGAGMTVAALIDDRFHFDRILADYSMYELSEVLTILDQLAAVNQQ